MTSLLSNPEKVTTIHDCLSHPRRRYTLHCLKEADQPLALADLAEDVAGRETERSRSELSAETVTSVHVTLYHNHVPKLDDAGVVQYDRERDLVELSEVSGDPGDADQLLPIGGSHARR